MAEIGFPFTSSGGVPSYTAAQFAKYFEPFFNDGVSDADGGALEVTAQGTPAMAVDVAAGIAYSLGYQLNMDAPKSLAIGSNSSGSTRIDSIIAEIDILNRAAMVKVLPGTPGAGAPTLTNDDDTRQVELARVTVVNGETAINTGDITDTRVSSLPQVDLVGLATVIDDPITYYFRRRGAA